MSLASKKKAALVGLIHGNSILLAKRSEFWRGQKINLGGHWALFGGSIEDGESPSFAASRELMEEAQIYISHQDFVFFKCIQDSEWDLYIHFTEVASLIIPTLDEEHDESGWFNIDALNSFPHKIDSKIVSAILDYKSQQS